MRLPPPGEFGGLAALAALLPAYWLMMSLGTWRGFLQFFIAPHRWEKTQHGLDDGAAPERISERAPRYRLAVAAALLLAAVAIALAAARAPSLVDYRRQVRAAALEDVPLLLDAECVVETSWIDRERVVARVRCGLAPGADPPLRAILHLKVWDGEWYEAEAEATPVRDGYVVAVPLDAEWRGIGIGSERPWCRDCLRRVRAAGIRLYGSPGSLAAPTLEALDALGGASVPALAIAITAMPRRAHEYQVVEVPFTLSRAYANPYDPEQIAVDAEVRGPEGSVAQVPAFYTQDYRRRDDPRREKLMPVGMPHWAVRYAPRVAGTTASSSARASVAARPPNRRRSRSRSRPRPTAATCASTTIHAGSRSSAADSAIPSPSTSARPPTTARAASGRSTRPILRGGRG